MTTNPHSDISIDDYQPDEFVGDEPREYDRTTEHRRHQHAPQDLRDRPATAPAKEREDIVVGELPADAAPEIERRAPGNREQRRAAEKARRLNGKRAESAGMTPVEREANGITVTSVDYDGETYWVPVDPEDWDARATRAFEDGKAMTALQYILEPDEEGRPGYALLESKHYRMKHINELFDKVAEVGGFETAGN